MHKSETHRACAGIIERDGGKAVCCDCNGHKCKPTTPTIEESDWRKSAKADELRAFLDKEFRVRKPTLGGLEREVLVDFVAKEIDSALTQQREHIAGEVEKMNGNPRHYCNCEECHQGQEYVKKSDILTLLQTSPRSK